jgi:hypothetical protein
LNERERGDKAKGDGETLLFKIRRKIDTWVFPFFQGEMSEGQRGKK